MVRVVAPIHDVGKIGIPDAMLLKAGTLTDDEYGIMKSHSVYGEEIINRFDILANEARSRDTTTRGSTAPATRTTWRESISPTVRD